MRRKSGRRKRGARNGGLLRHTTKKQALVKMVKMPMKPRNMGKKGSQSGQKK